MVRLPGISFQTLEGRSPEDGLHLDVPAFVGFASSGPVDVPVPISDTHQFREIFGEDLALAWDGDRGTVQRAYLGPAVRAFFRNGGRRCWVIRVAGKAETSRFYVPGLMATTPGGGTFSRVELAARSAGSWADPLRVGSRLELTPLPGAQPERDANGLTVRIPWSVRQRVHPGDLLQLEFQGYRAFMAVDTAHEGNRADRFWRVSGRGFWFAQKSPPDRTEIQVRCQDRDGNWHESAGFWLGPDEAKRQHYTLFMPITPWVGPGALLELRQGAGGPPVLFSAGKVQAIDRKEQTDWESMRGNGVLLITGREPLLPLTPEQGWEETASCACERIFHVTFELWTEQPDARVRQLSHLGLTPQHQRFVGFLPNDAELFLGPDERAPMPDGPHLGEQIRLEASSPRFPLAATEGLRGAICLPIGMDQVRWPEVAAAAMHDLTRPELVRNGLARFTAELFVDPDLAGLPVADIGPTCLHTRHMRRNHERLRGIHAVWPLDEVTLVAVPDAVHIGWEKEPVKHWPAPPVLQLQRPPGRGAFRLNWQPVPEARAYCLEEGIDPAFTEVWARHELKGQTQFEIRLQPPFERFYRLRAELEHRIGPWSNTIHLMLPAPDFEPYQKPPKPQLSEPMPTGNGRVVLRWGREIDLRGEEYELQSAHEPDFRDPFLMEMGHEVATTVIWDYKTPVFYRVRARWGDLISPWSNTVFLQPESQIWRMNPPNPDLLEGDLDARADALADALRLALARGDLLFVLAMPAHYRSREATSLVRYLSGKLRQDELAALSHGTLYYPWVRVQEEQGRAQLIPPDGPVMGQIAYRTRERGAWSAPANQNLTGVSGLHHHIDPDSLPSLVAEHINLIRPDVGGYRTYTALTLSQAREVSLMGVRRLMILLRRLLQREGSRMVFAPNDEGFREMAVLRVERLMMELYMRGAFAGDNPDEAFEVSAPDALNDVRSREQGRLVIDVRVAPSHPLAFITVRLSQAHDGSPVVREV